MTGTGAHVPGTRGAAASALFAAALSGLLGAFLLSGCLLGGGDDAVLKGTVRDEVTGARLEDVTVRIDLLPPQAIEDYEGETRTDRTGRFTVVYGSRRMPPNRILCERRGYRPRLLTIPEDAERTSENRYRIEVRLVPQ